MCVGVEFCDIRPPKQIALGQHTRILIRAEPCIDVRWRFGIGCDGCYDEPCSCVGFGGLRHRGSVCLMIFFPQSRSLEITRLKF